MSIAFCLLFLLGLGAVSWMTRKKRNRWVKNVPHPSFWGSESRGKTMCR